MDHGSNYDENPLQDTAQMEFPSPIGKNLTLIKMEGSNLSCWILYDVFWKKCHQSFLLGYLQEFQKQQVLLLERSGFWTFLNSTCHKFNMTIHHFFAWRPLPLEWDSWPLASAIWRPWKAHCFKLTIPSCWTACLQLVPRWKSSWSPKTKKAGEDMVSDGGTVNATRKKRLLLQLFSRTCKNL